MRILYYILSNINISIADVKSIIISNDIYTWAWYYKDDIVPRVLNINLSSKGDVINGELRRFGIHDP